MTQPDLSIKASLLLHCQHYVAQRIRTAQQAMDAAQEAANSESKSSAGDKYETGRAMAQLERDRNAQLLAEALKLQQDLNRLMVEKPYDTAQPGSLVQTNRGAFFISISAGKLTHNGQDYFAISPASPIATALAGKKTGDTLTFNKQPYQVLGIC